MNEHAVRSAWGYLHQYWLHPRRKRFWAIVLLLVYTLIGFFGVPWLAGKVATEMVREDLGRQLRIGDIYTNPWALTLRIDRLALEDTDGEHLAGFDRLFVNFSLSSVFHRAWTFSAVHLDRPTIREERYPDGKTRFSTLIGDLAAEPTQPDGPKDEDAGLPSLIIAEVRIDQGTAHFMDHLPEQPVEVELEPVTVRLDNLDTRPDQQGHQSVELALQSGGAVAWEGTFGFAPLHTSGTVEVDAVVVEPFVSYLRGAMPIRNLDLVFGGRFDFSASLPAEGPSLEIDELNAHVSKFRLSAHEPEVDVLAADAVDLESASYRYGDNRLRIESVDVSNPHVRTWLDPAGELGLLTLLPKASDAGEVASPAGAGASESPASGASRPLSVQLSTLRIDGLDVDLEDRGVDPPAPIGLRDVGIEMDDINLAEGTVFPTRLQGRLATGGDISFDGNLRISPSLDFGGALRVDNLDLRLLEPWVQQRIRLDVVGGTARTEGQLRITAEEPLAYEGSVGVDGLDLVEKGTDRQVLGWNELRIDRLRFLLGKGELQTSLVTLQQPSGRIMIAEDQSTNVGGLLVESDGAEPPPTEDRGAPFAVAVDGIVVREGGLFFSDLSLPLPFATRVKSLDGRVSTLSSSSKEPAELEFEGQVEDYGLARISGVVNAWQPTRATDIRMVFKNLRMPDYSPYAIPFAGHRIASGRMDLDLTYKIDQGRLQGSNKVVLKDLKLGEKVPHPDATSLPLSLGIALLKDSDGVIDINLEVEGDVGDPQFNIASVIRQSLVGLLTRVVSSPFKMLASLVGMDPDEFGAIEFPPGRSDLTPPQRERVAKLAEALSKRPELVIEIVGVYDPEVDRTALQRQQALSELRARRDEPAANLSLTGEPAREPLRAMFAEYYPDTDPAKVRRRFTTTDEESEEERFDAVAYHAWLAERVVAAQTVTRADLETLGYARAATVEKSMLEWTDEGATGEALDPERVRVMNPEKIDAPTPDRVPMEPGLTAR